MSHMAQLTKDFYDAMSAEERTKFMRMLVEEQMEIKPMRIPTGAPASATFEIYTIEQIIPGEGWCAILESAELDPEKHTHRQRVVCWALISTPGKGKDIVGMITTPAGPQLVRADLCNLVGYEFHGGAA